MMALVMAAALAMGAPAERMTIRRAVDTLDRGAVVVDAGEEVCEARLLSLTYRRRERSLESLQRDRVDQPRISGDRVAFFNDDDVVGDDFVDRDIPRSLPRMNCKYAAVIRRNAATASVPLLSLNLLR